LDVQELSLYEFLLLMRAKRAILVWVMSATAVLALLIGILSKNQYKASSTLAPVSISMAGHGIEGLGSSLGSLAMLAGLGKHDEGIEENIAVLGSRALADEFVNQYQLAPILFEPRWDDAAKRWKQGMLRQLLGRSISRVLDSLEGKSIEQSNNFAPTPDEIFRAFDKVRSISEDKDTGLVTLTLELHNPNLAASLTNEYVNAANEHIRKEKIREAQQSLEYLSQELQKTNLAEMHAALSRLIEDELKQSMIANVREQYAFKVIDPATVPELRAWPKVGLLLATGIFGGLMLGIGIILVGNRLRAARDAHARGAQGIA